MPSLVQRAVVSSITKITWTYASWMHVIPVFNIDLLP